MVDFKQKVEETREKKEFVKNVIRKSQVTVPVLSTRGGAHLFLMFLSKPVEKADTDKDGKPKLRDNGEPATIWLVDCFDLIERQKCQLVLHTVIRSELKENYPNGYTGLCFEIEIPAEKAKDKNYKIPRIYEIHPPEWVNKELGLLLPPCTHDELLALNEPKQK